MKNLQLGVSELHSRGSISCLAHAPGKDGRVAACCDMDTSTPNTEPTDQRHMRGANHGGQ